MSTNNIWFLKLIRSEKIPHKHLKIILSRNIQLIFFSSTQALLGVILLNDFLVNLKNLSAQCGN